MLGLVGLSDLAGKRMRTLSGGQRRRAALAQALIGSPELLVLDEPTTGLDPEQRASLRGVLSGAGHRSTMLLATHQTEDVAALCERVIVLDGGPGAVGRTGHRSWSPPPPAMCGWPPRRSRQRCRRGGPAPAATATSPWTRRSASRSPSRASRMPTCCCGPRPGATGAGVSA